MAERLYLRDIRARIGIALKLIGCALVHGRVAGRTDHPWGPWRTWPDCAEEVRACVSCGTYDHRQVGKR